LTKAGHGSQQQRKSKRNTFMVH